MAVFLRPDVILDHSTSPTSTRNISETTWFRGIRETLKKHVDLRLQLRKSTLLAEPFFCLLDFGVLEKDCMNRVRSFLSMRCMLPGYSLEPKPNMPGFAVILVFHGTAGSIITIGFIIKRIPAPENGSDERKQD